MAIPPGECPHCGSPIVNGRMHAELSLVSVESGDIAATQRNFWGECPDHGTVQYEYKIGNHATLAESVFKRRYSKLARTLILARLSNEERRAFKKSLEGKRSPAREEVGWWDHLSIGARVGAFDRATATIRRLPDAPDTEIDGSESNAY